MNVPKTASLAILLAVSLAGTTAFAQGKKPSVAVLGLEVIDDGGIDAKSAKFATDLTDALRKRAKVGAGPFRLAPNSNKDLLEMKLLSGCANEARNCMSEIGKELGADRLIYGKVERRRGGYQVTLKLLNVRDKKMERSTTDMVLSDDTDAAAMNRWSRRLYNRLTGLPDEGTLVVTANVNTGTIYVDGEVKGSLAGGNAQISGLSEGKHEIRVESQGSTAFETEVVIKGGETHELAVSLIAGRAVSGRVDKGTERPGGGYRVLFWTAAVATAAGAGGTTFTGLKVWGELEEDTTAAINKYQEMGDQLDVGDPCGDARSRSSPTADLNAVIKACDKGESWARISEVLGGVSIATALAAGYFYYKGYIQPGASSSTERASAGKKRDSVVQFAPTITPTYLGAGVQIEF